MKPKFLRIEKFETPKYYYFRIVASNGEIIAQSEGYTTSRKRNKTVKLIIETHIIST